MKILIVGSGGREHAIAWKIAQTLYYTESFCGGKVRSKIFIKSLPIFHLTNLKRKHRIEGNRFIHV